MHESVTITFQADGNPCNVELGFIPDYVQVYNLNAGVGEPFKLEWFSLLGDGKEIRHNRVTDNGSSGMASMEYKSTGGYISAYQGVGYDPGTPDDDDDPVRAEGFVGVSIAAGFMDDDDTIVLHASRSLRAENLGDIA